MLGGGRYASVERKRDRSAGKRFTFKEQEARVLRKGGKPSRNAFKSKQRYVLRGVVALMVLIDPPCPRASYNKRKR